MVEQFAIPNAIAAEFRRSVEEFLRPDDPARQRLVNVRLTGIPIVQLDLHKLTPDSLTDTKLATATATSATGWLVLAPLPDGVVYGAEVMTGPSGAPEIGGIWRDPAFPELVRQLTDVVHLKELQGKENFEMKLISIPALLTDALWLSAGQQQFIVPVRYEGQLLPELKVIRLDHFFEDLAKIAPAYREFDDLHSQMLGSKPY